MYVCDGTADCVSGEDEWNCDLPESCNAWWEAGYREPGMYSIREYIQGLQWGRMVLVVFFKLLKLLCFAFLLLY